MLYTLCLFLRFSLPMPMTKGASQTWGKTNVLQIIKRALFLLLQNLGGTCPLFLRLYHENQRCAHHNLYFSDLNILDLNISDLNISDLNFWDLNISDLNFWDLNISDLNILDLNISDLNFWDLNISDLNFMGS